MTKKVGFNPFLFDPNEYSRPRLARYIKRMEIALGVLAAAWLLWLIGSALYLSSHSPHKPDIATGQVVPWAYKSSTFYITANQDLLIGLPQHSIFYFWGLVFLVKWGCDRLLDRMKIPLHERLSADASPVPNLESRG